MTTLVLCDGTEGCLRSIEVACAGCAISPSPASPEEASVVLAHVWSPKQTPKSAAPDSSHAADGDASGRLTGDAKAGTASPTGAVRQPSITMSCADVLATTLRYIHTNKYLRNKLHYVMETTCASSVPGGGDADSSAPADAAASADGTAASPAAPSKPGQAQARAANQPRRHSLGRPPEKQAGGPAGDGSGDKGAAQDEREAAARIPENEERALTIARYAATRAAHHNAAAILLGVGQRQDGKVYILGAVARRVLLSLRGTYPLYYVKKDGAKWRPGLATGTAPAVSAPLRFMIVVAVPEEVPCGSAAVARRRSGEEEAPQTTIVTGTPPGAPPQVPKHVQRAVAAAVRYLQARCMRRQPAGQADQISFAVVGTSSSQGGSRAAESDQGEAAAGPDAGAVCGTQLECYRRYLETLPVPQCGPSTTGEASLSPAMPASSGGPAAVNGGAGEGQGGAEDSAGAANAGDGARTARLSRSEAPLVTVCMLKGSKKNPHITIDSAPEVALPQIVKQVGALRPDVLVMPASLVPDSIQLALLATSNPHCIVLPV